jgi:hypothetical protein
MGFLRVRRNQITRNDCNTRILIDFTGDECRVRVTSIRLRIDRAIFIENLSSRVHSAYELELCVCVMPNFSAMLSVGI